MPIYVFAFLALAVNSWSSSQQSGALTAYACTRGQDRGICYCDSQGHPEYWIARRWGANGPTGEAHTGYAELQRQQQAYNRWVIAVQEHSEDFSGKVGEQTMTDRPFDGISFSDDPRVAGWAGSDLALPSKVPEDGQATVYSLSIPYYESAADVAAEWRRVQISCQFVWIAKSDDPQTELCNGPIAEFETGRFRYTDEALELWAERTKAAFDASKAVQQFIERQEFFGQPAETQDLTPATLPADFTDSYEALLQSVRARLAEGRNAAARVRQEYLK